MDRLESEKGTLFRYAIKRLNLTFAVEWRRRSGGVRRRVVRARPAARLAPLRLVVALKTTQQQHIVEGSKKLNCNTVKLLYSIKMSRGLAKFIC